MTAYKRIKASEEQEGKEEAEEEAEGPFMGYTIATDHQTYIVELCDAVGAVIEQALKDGPDSGDILPFSREFPNELRVGTTLKMNNALCKWVLSTRRNLKRDVLEHEKLLELQLTIALAEDLRYRFPTARAEASCGDSKRMDVSIRLGKIMVIIELAYYVDALTEAKWFREDANTSRFLQAWAEMGIDEVPMAIKTARKIDQVIGYIRVFDARNRALLYRTYDQFVGIAAVIEKDPKALRNNELGVMSHVQVINSGGQYPHFILPISDEESIRVEAGQAVIRETSVTQQVCPTCGGSDFGTASVCLECYRRATSAPSGSTQAPNAAIIKASVGLKKTPEETKGSWFCTRCPKSRAGKFDTCNFPNRKTCFYCGRQRPANPKVVQ